METWLASPYLLLFARLTLGGVFLLGTLGKLRDPAGSLAALKRRAWVPDWAARLGVWGLPLLEAVVGGLLLAGLGLQWAAFAAAAMMVVFTANVLADLSRGKAEPCHCFGSFSRENVSALTLVRDLALLGLAAALAWHPVHYLALDALFAASGAPMPSPVNAVPVGLLALLAVFVVVFGGSFMATIRGFLRAF
ncbi:MAG: MauE/DoxX family redox-associated membrane protein [Chloroflexia bacterium]